MHTATMLTYQGKRVMIDCGENWIGKITDLKPHAIVITHPHPDHAFGLKLGSPCPVYATAEAWKKMKFPIRKEFRRMLTLRRPQRIGGISFEAFPVVHSVRAPAVGYRISAGKIALFYVPDVVRILNRAGAFSGIRTYIGDGATITRPLIRRDKRNHQLIGHTSIETQLRWCRKERVSEMIVTHCGSAIVGGNKRDVQKKLEGLGYKYGVRVEIAHDGMDLVLH
ncbi:MAG TPA: MBL fold metallo-hydrolase [Candidatus Binatia bacterium]|nr:MBL fold metallo-hydrolase [Candidatus Binatia bacterium]